MVSHTMGTSTEEIHMSDGRHPSSQLSRLCPACQSVLTRDDLEINKKYLHHNSLEAFIKAKHMNCYVCSHLFRPLGSIPEDIQEALRLAAERKKLDNVVEDGTQFTDDGASKPRADLVQNLARHRGEATSVSCTCLYFYCSRGSCLKIQGDLNPLYNVYFPLNTLIYDISLRAMWEKLRDSLFSAERLMIVPHQGI